MKLYYLIPTVALFCLSACSDSDTVKQEESNEFIPLTLPANQSRVASASNDFGVKMFDAVVKDQGDVNVLISPLSAGIVLSMIDNAANGETCQELTEVLGFADDVDVLNAYNKSLIEYLPEVDNTTELFLPSSMWFTIDDIKSDFQSQIQNFYAAEINATTNENLSVDVNNWVSEKTNGKIPSILNETEKAYVAFVNTVYFNGTWKVSFDEENTVKEEFNNLDQSVSSVEYLKHTALVDNGGGENYSAISYPFGNGAFTLDVYLPDDSCTTEDVIKNICDNGVCNFEYKTLLNLQLPKISMSQTTDLRSALMSMGIHKIFMEFADLTKMSDMQGLYVNIFRQANAIDLSEKGVEATSATVATVSSTVSGPVTDSFIVDRPFLFMVRETSTNTILLAGRINQL